MEGLGINLGYLIVQIGAFLVLYVLMKAFAFGPITRMLEGHPQIQLVGSAAIARDNADAEAKKVLDAARAEAAQIRADAAVQAEETASGILNKANSDPKQYVVEKAFVGDGV